MRCGERPFSLIFNFIFECSVWCCHALPSCQWDTKLCFSTQCSVGDWKTGGGGLEKSKWICTGESLMREELQCFSGHYKTNVLMVLHQLVLTQKQEYRLETRDTHRLRCKWTCTRVRLYIHTRTLTGNWHVVECRSLSLPSADWQIGPELGLNHRVCANLDVHCDRTEGEKDFLSHWLFNTVLKAV